MKDVIDVPASAVRHKPRFLTGTPAWLEGPLGAILGGLMVAAGLYKLYSWMFP